MTGNRRKIALIGGGASGTLTAIHLIKQATCPLDLVMFERDKTQLFRGVAYSGNLPVAPLNVPASGMSAYSEQPLHFWEWLRLNKSETIQQTDFVSRIWFGDYLTEQLNDCVKESDLVRFRTEQAEAEKIRKTIHGWELFTNEGQSDWYDAIVFCTGNQKPVELLDAEVRNRSGFKANPWNWDIQSLNSNARVLIIGTGLTMVDQVLSLHAQKHQGKIIAISRNGKLPARHTRIPGSKTAPEDVPANILELFNYLRKNIRRDPATPWQYYVDGIRHLVPKAWQNAGIEDRKLFLSRFRKYWEIHRHRIPESSSETILDMQRNGQLEIHAGSLFVSFNLNNSFDAEVINRKGEKIKISEIGVILNCTGPDPDLRKSAVFLNMFESGYAVQDELKLGLKCNTEGALLGKNGEVSEGLFAIGPLRKSENWESTALREIREQSESLSKMWMQHQLQTV